MTARSSRKGKLKRAIKALSKPSRDKDGKIQRVTLTVEILWSFFEYYMVLVISGAMAHTTKTHFLMSFNPWPRVILETIIYVFFHFAFLHFILQRQGKKFGCNTFGEYMSRLGLRKFAWSKMGSYMMGYHISVFLGMLAVQYSEGTFYYTIDNFFWNDEFALRWLVSIWIVTPIREEVYFRGCLFTTAIHRSQYLSIPILITGLVFGSAHLLNLFRPDVSVLYVILQFLSAVVVGIFFCLRFLVTGTLWESILIHFISNATSSFLPANEDFDFADPKIGLPMSCTLMLYVVMSYYSLQQLKKHPTWGPCFKEKLCDVRHPFERPPEAISSRS